MAKVGEGDPRWIVSERKDGANVNAWHWEERDLTEHAHQTITKSLCKKRFFESKDGIAYIEVEEVVDCGGDMTVAQRKGKMMLYWELKFTAKWVAKMDDDSEIRGRMEVPEVDHDEYMNDFEVRVTCAEKGDAASKVEDIVRSKGRSTVREIVREFINKICSEYHIGETLKGSTTMPPPPQKISAADAQKKSRSSNQENSKNATHFSWNIRWGVPAEEVFLALTDEKRIAMYTRRPATVDASPGGQFQFLGGVITGYFVDIQAPTLLKLQWRLSSWEKGVHSSVVIQFIKEEPGVTRMEFAQTGIPSDQLECVKEGWRSNFFSAIKLAFGYTLDYL